MKELAQEKEDPWRGSSSHNDRVTTKRPVLLALKERAVDDIGKPSNQQPKYGERNDDGRRGVRTPRGHARDDRERLQRGLVKLSLPAALCLRVAALALTNFLRLGSLLSLRSAHTSAI